MEKNSHPLVAIKCFVYNHEPYLRECLDGFVMQQTDFPFVAIVHDDASTDHSADIIREYAAKYPDIIHPIYETENQYSKQDGSLGRIIDAAINATGAKYIAMCEGDDYWTDPHKLQKQVDFLEMHPDFSICFHRCKTLVLDTGEIIEKLIRDMLGESTIYDLAHGNYIYTLSVLYRRNEEVQAKQKTLGYCMPGDYVLWMLLAEKGKIWELEDSMGVYRYGCGVWSSGKMGISSSLHLMVVLAKLLVSVENSQVKSIIQKQIDEMYTELTMYESTMKINYNKIYSSYAYRLGRVLLKPFRIFKWLK